MSFRAWSNGAEICRYALAREAEFAAPYLQVHRPIWTMPWPLRCHPGQFA
ncbi:hypothetical protein HEP84_51475 [Streptomyces sp. RLB1-33]|nr:hypothetical protein [Streptomyces sp. RLB1-33]QIY76101.1 hypothetical protein HEP84_51475 [Streptomyces sp. RLB1-33]